MFFRQLLNEATACASYVVGCKTEGLFAVVDAHEDLVGEYVAIAESQGAAITAVLETHVQADHVSGLPQLARRTGATAYLPHGADVGFEHVPLRDREVVTLGNVDLAAIATPGHAPEHHAYAVTDLHAGDAAEIEAMAHTLYRSLTQRLLTLPDHVVLCPAHFSGSVCGRGLSGNPLSTVGFERRHNAALQHGSEEAFVAALLRDLPPAPDHQAAIVAANRAA
jgi:hydroxyacylglutathione hydrolase